MKYRNPFLVISFTPEAKEIENCFRNPRKELPHPNSTNKLTWFASRGTH